MTPFIPFIGWTVEIIRSLATKSLDEAKRLSRPLADATDALFEEAEGLQSQHMRFRRIFG
ncbi:DUF6538 domain-containing protein [Rhodospirillum rubrum]|uniref:DUF6538 domain-containing protein n=1 Tax=Rhodospirillum rubrum TaxID=1085 RepID=UPI002ED84A8B